MQKHTFEASNIYIFFKKNIQNMLEYWPYAARKKTFFFLQYFFFDEIGYFNTEFVSLRYKNTTQY